MGTKTFSRSFLSSFRVEIIYFRVEQTEQKIFAKSLSKNSNLDDSGIALPVFPSRTNLTLNQTMILRKYWWTSANVLRSRNLWHPQISFMPRNKRNILL